MFLETICERLETGTRLKKDTCKIRSVTQQGCREQKQGGAGGVWRQMLTTISPSPSPPPPPSLLYSPPPSLLESLPTPWPGSENDVHEMRELHNFYLLHTSRMTNIGLPTEEWSSTIYQLWRWDSILRIFEPRAWVAVLWACFMLLFFLSVS